MVEVSTRIIYRKSMRYKLNISCYGTCSILPSHVDVTFRSIDEREVDCDHIAAVSRLWCNSSVRRSHTRTHLSEQPRASYGRSRWKGEHCVGQYQSSEDRRKTLHNNVKVTLYLQA